MVPIRRQQQQHQPDQRLDLSSLIWAEQLQLAPLAASSTFLTVRGSHPSGLIKSANAAGGPLGLGRDRWPTDRPTGHLCKGLIGRWGESQSEEGRWRGVD